MTLTLLGGQSRITKRVMAQRYLTDACRIKSKCNLKFALPSGPRARVHCKLQGTISLDLFRKFSDCLTNTIKSHEKTQNINTPSHERY